jgi:tripartite-type tricarboxylate transporter receptor subunit TctC
MICMSRQAAAAVACDDTSIKKRGSNAMSGWFGRVTFIAALMLAPLAARAESPFPSRPVHFLVPYPAGGAVDILARTLGEELSKTWGSSVVVENRPGAGGVLASQALATAAPDGYTVMVVASGHATNPFLYAKLPYDTFKDFTPISLLASSPNIVLVRTDSPYKTLADLLAAAKAKPGDLSYGMAGNGTSTHLAGELLKDMAKVNIVAIPYKGGGPAMNDLLAGQIPVSLNNGPESIGQISAGTVRALGVTTSTRLSSLPDIPTIAEAGVPGYDTEVWWGLLGPAKLPPDLVAKLSADFVAAVNLPEVKDRLAKMGATSIGSSPQQFEAKIKADYDKWGPIFKEAGIKAE